MCIRDRPKIGPGFFFGVFEKFETFFSKICTHSERYRNLLAGIFEILTFYGNIAFPLSPVLPPTWYVFILFTLCFYSLLFCFRDFYFSRVFFVFLANLCLFLLVFCRTPQGHRMAARSARTGRLPGHDSRQGSCRREQQAKTLPAAATR